MNPFTIINVILTLGAAPIKLEWLQCFQEWDQANRFARFASEVYTDISSDNNVILVNLISILCYVNSHITHRDALTVCLINAAN